MVSEQGFIVLCPTWTLCVHDSVSEIVQTPFREFRRVYERYKAEALVKHCQSLAEIARRAASIRPYPDRDWLWLEEWEEPIADYDPRRGRWLSDVEVEWLP